MISVFYVRDYETNMHSLFPLAITIMVGFFITANQPASP